MRFPIESISPDFEYSLKQTYNGHSVLKDTLFECINLETRTEDGKKGRLVTNGDIDIDKNDEKKGFTPDSRYVYLENNHYFQIFRTIDSSEVARVKK